MPIFLISKILLHELYKQINFLIDVYTEFLHRMFNVAFKLTPVLNHYRLWLNVIFYKKL